MQMVSRRLLIGAALFMSMSFVLPAQDGRYDEGGRYGRSGRFGRGGQYGIARGLVDRVQRDLRRAERFSRPRGREQERFYNATRHLSEFDRNLSRNKFDKDKLDEAIDDVKNVVEHNSLSPNERDVLFRDLTDLRDLRRARGASY